MKDIADNKWELGNRLFIIAEAAQAYEGHGILVNNLIRAALHGGADAVKFQILTWDEVGVPSYKLHDYHKSLELPLEFWGSQIEFCHRSGIEFYADVFGIDTAIGLEKRGADGFKVHATDLLNIELLEVLRDMGRPIILSSAGSTPEEVEKALTIMGEDVNVVIMHGFQALPTNLLDIHLNRIHFLYQRFGKPVGLSDHLDGESELARYLPLIAIGMGVRVVEKHITLSREIKGEDYFSALNPEEFRVMTKCLRDSIKALGPEGFHMPEPELVYRRNAKKRVVASKNIKTGDILSRENICLKKSDEDGGLFSTEVVRGKRAKVAIEKYQVITDDMLE